MVIKIRILRVFLVALILGFLAYTRSADALTNESRTNYEKSVTSIAKTLKTIYEPGEPVPIVLAISNHSSRPIYTFQGESDFLGGFSLVFDTNGVRIMGDPIPTPPPPPLHYYMEKDGKRIYVVPVYKIDGPGVMVAVIADALRIHHKHLSEGTFYLDLGDIEIIHKVSDLIVREDVPHKLWIDPRSPITRIRHKLNPVKIQIRRKTEDEKSVVKARSFAWSTFLTGTIAGIVVVCLILTLKRKAIRRSK